MHSDYARNLQRKGLPWQEIVRKMQEYGIDNEGEIARLNALSPPNPQE